MNAPIFVISDLHIGSGGTRDSFAQNNRHLCFNKFLDYVEKEDGELIILGDFIDLWRFNLRKVIKARTDLLDRLAQMKVSCIPGNHDQVFTSFINSHIEPHPFFRKITKPFTRSISGRKFGFLHGHELDILNRNLTPLIGRILGLSSSLIEYAKGYPVFSSNAIEEVLLDIEENIFLFCLDIAKRMANFANVPDLMVNIQVLPRQKRVEKMLLKHELKKNMEGNDVTISAHTHRPCRFQDWYFNSGSWTDTANDFIQILPDGKVNLFDWDKDIPRKNNIEVKSSGIFSNYKTNYIMVN